MSDTSPGDRLDGIIADVQDAADALRAKLEPKLAELGAEVSQALTNLSAKLDELAAAVG